MIQFDNLAAGIIDALSISTLNSAPPNPKFDEFKSFVISYIIENSKVEQCDPLIGQIQNCSAVDEIECLLLQIDYCDECFLKLYRKFASGVEQQCIVVYNPVHGKVS